MTVSAPKEAKRKQFIFLASGVTGFVAILILCMWISDPNRGKPTALEEARARADEVKKSYKIDSNTSVSDQENWISKSEKVIAAMQQENQVLQGKLDTVTKKLEEIDKVKNTAMSSVEKVVDGNLSSLAMPPPPVLATGSVPNLPQPASMLSGPQSESKPVSTEIESISLSDASSKSVVKKKNIERYLPTGAFMKVALLNGLDAPTGGLAQSNPMPVSMRLMDDGTLPNYFGSNVKDCHAIGAAYGEISSERAHIRMESISCVLATGEVIESPIKGFVAGEDGKSGFRGRLVSKQGALIARAALAGIFAGIGDVVSQQYQQVSTSPLGSVTTFDPKKIGEAGAARGTSTAMEKIADFWMARANETFPILEIAAGREGEIILTGGSDLGEKIIGATRREPVEKIEE